MTQTATETETDAQGDEKIYLETGGDLWRSLTGLLDALVDECKVRFDAADGDSPTLSVTAVDPANVGMVHVEIPAEAFDAYRVPEDHTLGLSLSSLTRITDYARKGGNSKDDPGDPVLVEQVGERVYVRVEPDDKMIRTGSFFGIDPHSIREEPDIPDLHLSWRGDVDTTELRDAVAGIKTRFDHLLITTTDRDGGNGSLSENEQRYLSLYAHDKTSPDDAPREITDEDEFRTQERVMEQVGDSAAASLFSIDYLRDMTQALVRAGVDRTTLHVGDEFPLKLRFSEDRFGISGQYMLAPRIGKDERGDGRATVEEGPTWGDRFQNEEPEEDDPETCFAGDCENPVSEEAQADGYPLCEDHDDSTARSLYDDRHADEEGE